MDYAQGKPLKLPNLPDWEGHVSSSMLESEPGVPVLMANDADFATQREHRYGVGRGSRDMVYVTSSTDVGAGVILRSHLLHAKRPLAEIEHDHRPGGSQNGRATRTGDSAVTSGG